MIIFPLSELDSYIGGTNDGLKRVIESFGPHDLPLQQGLARSSAVADKPFSAIILACTHDTSVIQAKVGIFYTGIIAGCQCADDPSPMDEQTEYCELLFVIDKQTGNASVSFLDN